MATSAFKSATKRSSFGGAGSSNRSNPHRRSRSLSRFSGRFPPPGDEVDPPPALTRGSIVNAAHGAGFPEISLDDLADELFRADETGRGGVGGRRFSDAGFQMCTESSRGRGRSVSRTGSWESNAGVKGVHDGGARRRRSVSVARHLCSDSESLSSTLTDDEMRVVHENRKGSEKTIRTVYAQKKMEHSGGNGEGNLLHEAMHKEIRHAVEEIRTELEKVVVNTQTVVRNESDDVQSRSSESFEAIAEIRRNYTSKLEKSEMRRQELLAELEAEEQRGHELTKIVKELLQDTKESSPSERDSRFRKRSSDRTRISKHLSEEAEKYFVDFISNVEDTDISSFDGDKSDGSSSIGGTKSSGTAGRDTYLSKAFSLPAETDGLVLPWLDWETCTDGTPSCNDTRKTHGFFVSGTKLFCSEQEACRTHDDSVYLTSSHGSWSPGDNTSCTTVPKKNKPNSRVAHTGTHLDSGTKTGTRDSLDEPNDCNLLQDTEDLLFEGLLQRQRIELGGLILCRRSFLGD